MPGKKSRYRRRERSRNKCNPKEGEVCCQAMTKDGTQCKRIASVVFDLSKKQTFSLGPFKYEHPGVKCCAFCWQHAAVIATNYGLKLWDILTATIGPKLSGFTPEETLFANYPRWSHEKRKMYGVESSPF
jgi:hypothetical protein